MNSIEMTLDFSPNELDTEALETLTQTLYGQLHDLDEVENVSRIYHFNFREAFDPNLKSDDAGKPQSGWLALAFDTLKSSKILQAIVARLLGKRVKFKLKRRGKELEFESHSLSQQEVQDLVNLLKEF